MKKRDLKCCGNCISRLTKKLGRHINNNERCAKEVKTEGSFSYCSFWEYDHLQKTYRRLDKNI